jgi:hypothetical protein
MLKEKTFLSSRNITLGPGLDSCGSIGTSGGLLWMRQRTFRLYKMGGGDLLTNWGAVSCSRRTVLHADGHCFCYTQLPDRRLSAVTNIAGPH